MLSHQDKKCVEEIIKELQDGHLADASKHLNYVLKKQPWDMSAAFLCATNALAESNTKQALDDFEAHLE